MKIDFAKLQYQYQLYKEDVDQRIHSVLDNSNYIMGKEVQELESQLCAFTGAKHAITCSNGTDALILAMMAMDIQPGDEIITTPFTFIATAETIAFLKAKPVFVDVEECSFNIDANKIESAITSKTKAIMPVSLFGQPSDLTEINKVAKKYNLKIIVDGAQSFGATYHEQHEIQHCDIYTTSFFPAKPLGCYGDGGAVFTNNDKYAEKMKMMRMHGQNKRYHHKYIGMGGRLDTIQAAVLLAKLPYYQTEISDRNRVALTYAKYISSNISLPVISENRTSVWAQYTLRVENRERIQKLLKKNGVPTAVHYPMPLHLQECFLYLGYQQGDFPVSEVLSLQVMSLPMNPFLSTKEILYVSKQLGKL